MALINPWLDTNEQDKRRYSAYPPPPTTPGTTPPAPVPASTPWTGNQVPAPAPAAAPATSAPVSAPAPATAPRSAVATSPGSEPTPHTPYPPPPTTPGAGDVDPYIAEVRAAGQGKSEDYARFSDAELMAWKQYYIGNGKYRNIYGDIVDKPDERGPNTPHNRNGTGDQGDFGWGYNDSGVGGNQPAAGSGGGGGGIPGNPDDMTAKSQTLWDEIMNLQSRYSPEVMQTLMAGAKRQGSQAGSAARESANLDAVRRGLGRSTANISNEAARTAEANVVNPASSFYTAEKIKGDQEDKITKLNAMQNWINSARQHIQAMTATANAKQIALANLDLAERRLQQELEMQRINFEQQMTYRARWGGID